MATKKKSTKKKATKKSATKKKAKTAKKSAAKKGKTKRKPNAAFMKPLTPTAKLAEIVGDKALPRTEAVKKLWVYIKKHGLQDKKNKRMINNDDKMYALFGEKQISMFDIAKVLNKNLK